MNFKNDYPLLVGILLGAYTLFSFSYGFWLLFSGVFYGVFIMYSGLVFSVLYGGAVLLIPLFVEIHNKTRLKRFRQSLLLIPLSMIIVYFLGTIVSAL